MSNLVVAAIPAEDDYVWKISSEKVPHCTLLFLGETLQVKNLTKIRQFVEHAVNIWEQGPFWLSVDHRGELGEDKADVLFFREDWSTRELARFRGQLLQEPNIKTAYDSVEQFDGWTPHLTLGYPETPAKEDKRDYPGIHDVRFDRIALWYGDYEGPEWRLEYNYDLMEVAMGAVSDAGREFIAHYGVKGMRWGVRNSSPSAVTTKSVVNAGLKSKTKVKAKGGQAHPAHEDAVKAAMQKQVLKKSGTAALSNQELRELGTRLELEQRVKTLAAPAGKKFVTGQLKTQGQQTIQRETSRAVDKALSSRR